MRTCFTSSTRILLAISLLAFSSTEIEAARVRVERGKVYKLTKDAGPWMIMVASFNKPPEKFRSDEGLSPEEAANELVYELRKKGFPAYVFKRDEVVQRKTYKTRQSELRKVKYTADHGGVSVLAGNFNSADSRNAKKSLESIKKYQPKFLSEVDKTSNNLIKLKSGGILGKTPGRETPLSRAFLTVNPLLSQEELQSAKDRPLLLKLNSGQEYSLLKNPGKYTVTVASFRGNSLTKITGKKSKNPFKVTNSLDQAGLKAWELAKVLRSRKVEAYVFHDKYKSVVTVGSFESENDPGVHKTVQAYGATEVVDKNSGKKSLQPQSLFLSTAKKNAVPKYWLYDVKPLPIPVPKLKR